MIEQTSFLGMPLRTQRQRRLLVVLYYAVLFAFALLAVCKTRGTILYLLPQTLTLGGLLGGIKIGGPVKAYEELRLPLAASDGTQTLNLSGRKPFDPHAPGGWSPLDEREQMRRDRAHYEAYRILRWTVGIAAAVYLIGLSWRFSLLTAKAPILLWILLVYMLSLPQSVVLWTEPDEPAGELGEVRAGTR